MALLLVMLACSSPMLVLVWRLSTRPAEKRFTRAQRRPEEYFDDLEFDDEASQEVFDMHQSRKLKFEFEGKKHEMVIQEFVQDGNEIQSHGGQSPDTHDITATHLWHCSILLGDWILNNYSKSAEEDSNAKMDDLGLVLELGAGSTAVPSQILSLVSDTKPVATDKTEDILELQKANLISNIQINHGRVQPLKLDWGNPRDLETVYYKGGPFQTVIASETLADDAKSQNTFHHVLEELFTKRNLRRAVICNADRGPGGGPAGLKAFATSRLKDVVEFRTISHKNIPPKIDVTSRRDIRDDLVLFDLKSKLP